MGSLKARDAVSQDMVMAGYIYPRDKNHPDKMELGHIGDIENGEGVRIAITPHYLFLQAETTEESGEIWIPLPALLSLISQLHAKIAN